MREEDREELIVIIRDLIREVRNQLILADQKQIGIEKSLFNSFLDRAGYILKNIEALPDEIKESLAEVISHCKQCIDILRNSGFIERYNSQIKALAGNPEDYPELSAPQPERRSE